MFLLLLPMAIAADCTQTTSADEVASTVHDSMTALRAQDLYRFNIALQEAHNQLPCLEDLLSAHQVAAFHQMEAIAAYLPPRNVDGTSASLAAALSSKPDFQLPRDLYPEGHPMQDSYSRAKWRTLSAGVPLNPPPQMTAYVNARASGLRHMELPTVVQLVSEDGRILGTNFIQPHGPNPDWSGLGGTGTSTSADADAVADTATETETEIEIETETETETEIETSPISKVQWNAKKTTTWGITGATAIASGALYVLARSYRSNYDDPATPYEELDGLRTKTHTASLASIGTGLFAIGLGSYAVLTVDF